MYILDTDHISLLQRGDKNVIANLARYSETQRVITVITVGEQMRGRLARVQRAKSEDEAARAFDRLNEAIQFFQGVPVLSYDPDAVAEFERLRRQKIRIGTQDLRIASIALIQKATVITRNRRDFGQVPRLSIEDWSKPVS